MTTPGVAYGNMSGCNVRSYGDSGTNSCIKVCFLKMFSASDMFDSAVLSSTCKC